MLELLAAGWPYGPTGPVPPGTPTADPAGVASLIVIGVVFLALFAAAFIFNQGVKEGLERCRQSGGGGPPPPEPPQEPPDPSPGGLKLPGLPDWMWDKWLRGLTKDKHHVG
jgi:hypothetical protein